MLGVQVHSKSSETFGAEKCRSTPEVKGGALLRRPATEGSDFD
jgi:hypothetical protein